MIRSSSTSGFTCKFSVDKAPCTVGTQLSVCTAPSGRGTPGQTPGTHRSARLFTSPPLLWGAEQWRLSVVLMSIYLTMIEVRIFSSIERSLHFFSCELSSHLFCHFFFVAFPAVSLQLIKEESRRGPVAQLLRASSRYATQIRQVCGSDHRSGVNA